MSFKRAKIGNDWKTLSDALEAAMSEKSYPERPYKYRGRSYVRPPIPKLIDNVLTTWDYELDRKIQSFNITKARNWKHWIHFLETEKSFRYERAGVSFTAMKERRAGSPGHPLRGGGEIYVWYAHRRIGGKLRRRYLGYAEAMDAERLYMAAFDLAQLELFDEK